MGAGVAGCSSPATDACPPWTLAFGSGCWSVSTHVRGMTTRSGVTTSIDAAIRHPELSRALVDAATLNVRRLRAWGNGGQAQGPLPPCVANLSSFVELGDTAPCDLPAPRGRILQCGVLVEHGMFAARGFLCAMDGSSSESQYVSRPLVYKIQVMVDVLPGGPPGLDATCDVMVGILERVREALAPPPPAVPLRRVVGAGVGQGHFPMQRFVWPGAGGPVPRLPGPPGPPRPITPPLSARARTPAPGITSMRAWVEPVDDVKDYYGRGAKEAVAVAVPNELVEVLDDGDDSDPLHDLVTRWE